MKKLLSFTVSKVSPFLLLALILGTPIVAVADNDGGCYPFVPIPSASLVPTTEPTPSREEPSASPYEETVDYPSDYPYLEEPSASPYMETVEYPEDYPYSEDDITSVSTPWTPEIDPYYELLAVEVCDYLFVSDDYFSYCYESFTSVLFI